MEAELNQEQAIWIVRALWFLCGALVMDSVGFLLHYFWKIEQMNLGGAVVTLVAGIVFVYLSIKWDRELVNQLKEEN